MDILNTQYFLGDVDNIGKPYQVPAEVYHLNTEYVRYSDCDCSELFQYLEIPPVCQSSLVLPANPHVLVSSGQIYWLSMWKQK